MKSLDDYVAEDFMPFDPIVKRTAGTVKNNKSGEKFSTTKGAPHVILKLVEGSSGEDHELASKVEADVHDLGYRGVRSLAVAKTDENGKWKFLGNDIHITYHYLSSSIITLSSPSISTI